MIVLIRYQKNMLENKSLDIEENIKDSLCKIMLNSDSESGSEYSSRDDSSTSEDLKAL